MGEFVGLLNHDDLYDPFWLRRAVYLFDKHPHIGWVMCANRVGGIPEMLGESGILVDWDHTRPPDIAAIAEKYVQEIRRLDDDAVYHHYHQKALARAQAYRLEQDYTAQYIHDMYFR